MAAGTLISVQEYLTTVYEPDCEYVDGVIVERNVGQYDHAKLQAALTAYLFVRRKQWGIVILTEQRIQVSPTHFRIPDICAVAGPEPAEPILTSPPFLCIEILSPDDRVISLQEKIKDYLAFGVRYVWVINPRTLETTVHTAHGMQVITDGILKTEDPEMLVRLSELFA